MNLHDDHRPHNGCIWDSNESRAWCPTQIDPETGLHKKSDRDYCTSSCPLDCRRPLLQCDNRCQSYHLPCNGTCDYLDEFHGLDYFQSCFGTCELALISDYRDWQCHDSCIPLNQPCGDKCAMKSQQLTCGGQCEFTPVSVWTCDRECIETNIPCRSKCPDEFWKCPTENKCIPLKYVCNDDNMGRPPSPSSGSSDTDRPSLFNVDELSCTNQMHHVREICENPDWNTTNVCAELDMVPCSGIRSGQCVYPARKCDGIYDCMDRTDESNCPEKVQNFTIDWHMLDLSKPCNVSGMNGNGMTCGDDCVPNIFWCNSDPKYDYSCSLAKLNSLELCSNSTFWQGN